MYMSRHNTAGGVGDFFMKWRNINMTNNNPNTIPNFGAELCYLLFVISKNATRTANAVIYNPYFC